MNNLRLIPLYLGMILCLQFSHALGQMDFGIPEVLSAPFPSDLTTHSHTAQVAWVFNQEGVRNIWIAAAPDLKGKPLTHYTKDDGQAIQNLAFTPDGSGLLFMRGGAPNRQGEIPNPSLESSSQIRALWYISTQGGDPRMIQELGNYALSPSGKEIAFAKGKSILRLGLEEGAEALPVCTIRGNPGSISWSPDEVSPKIAFVSSRGDHSFIGVYDLKNKRLRYLNPSVDLDRNPVWSPDGSKIAFARFPHEEPQIFLPRRSAPPWSIWVADVKTGEVQKVWGADPGMGSAYRSISANQQLAWGAGDRLVFPWEKEGWTQLYSIAVSGGNPVHLTPGEFEVQYVSLSHDGAYVFYSSNEADIDRQHIWQVSIKGGAPKRLSKGMGVEWAPVEVGREGKVVCLASGGRTPAYPALIDEEGGLASLAPNSLPDNFPTTHLTEPQQVVFTAADGMPIHGQLFLPPDQGQGKKHPGVLFFHGGSRRQMLLGFHHRGYYHNAYSLNQYLASQGYVVLSVNYRSGIGYGMKFREALNYGAGGASEFNDVLGAGLFLKSHPEVNPEKIGLWGGSYGGYLTALGLARASDLFAAGVDVHGVHDWNPVIQNFIPSYDPLRKPELAKLAYESSPMSSISGWRSPVLLIHGDDDRNVPFSETVDIANALRKEGVYFEQLIFPDEVHGFLLHKNWVAAYEATVDFFDRKLKNKE